MRHSNCIILILQVFSKTFCFVTTSNEISPKEWRSFEVMYNYVTYIMSSSNLTSLYQVRYKAECTLIHPETNNTVHLEQ